jgi:hypothetical protein
MMAGKLNSQSFRRLWPVELPAFRDHLIRLDQESRHARFTMAVSDDFLNQYAERCRHQRRRLRLFCCRQNARRGELRFDSPHNGQRRAEAAFSVEKPFQRDGMGSELSGGSSAPPEIGGQPLFSG